MNIEKIETDKKRFLDLLLQADEQEDMIDRYLDRGDMFALYDEDLKSICVVTDENSGVCELKNIATCSQYRGQGYGKRLVRYISDYYRGKYDVMLVGTGECPAIMSFYEACGFVRSHRVKNFFTDNYDHPIFEDGVQLVDMVYLRKNLKA
jgi:GNAT superfamily N-acetyltransferase